MNPNTGRTPYLSPIQGGQSLKQASAPLVMLTPTHAWRLLCRRTGGTISRTTFYRWINSGRVGAIRMGTRFLIPLPMLEEVIKKCLDGERI
jgi:excisionase family DNA binding protein